MLPILTHGGLPLITNSRQVINYFRLDSKALEISIGEISRMFPIVTQRKMPLIYQHSLGRQLF